MVPRTSSRLLSPPSRTPSRAKSYLSISASVEADDEGSAFDPLEMIDAEDHQHLEEGARRENYAGEDTRTTSTKELWGWYSYAFAAEVYAVCGLGSFIPMTLEQLAREQGVLLSDHSTPCPSSSSRPSANTPSALLNLVRSTDASPESAQCVVNILGLEMTTASFAMYTFSISVVFQTLTIISMSGAADHGHYRKTLLLGFAFVGSVATMLLLPVVPSVYLVASLLAIISNVGFGASFVLLNSFLPLLVRYHPTNDDVRERSGRDHAPANHQHHRDEQESTVHSHTDHDSQHNATAALLLPSTAIFPSDNGPPASVSQSPGISTALLLSTRISAYGIGIGYSAAVVFQILAILLLLLFSHPTASSTFPLRLIIFGIGLWWFIFTLPAALYLRPRPGPPLPTAQQSNLVTYIRHAWRTLGRTIVRASRLRDLTLFLAAWFLLSDALATVSGTAILFAKTELHMPLYALALINVVATLSGVLGALAWQRVATALHLSPTRALAACVILFELIPLYGLLGAIPAIRRLGFLGLQQDWEMYAVGAVYGLVLGGLGSYCRALFAELVPPGNEAVFFALYAVTDKGSSIFGPAVVGAITDRWGSIRPAFAFLVLLIGAPLPLIWALDVVRGKREAELLAKELAAEGKIGDGREGREEAELSEEAALLAEEHAESDAAEQRGDEER